MPPIQKTFFKIMLCVDFVMHREIFKCYKLHWIHALHYEEDVSENKSMKNRLLYYQVAKFLRRASPQSQVKRNLLGTAVHNAQKTN